MLSIRLGKEVLKKGRALRSGQKEGVISSRDIGSMRWNWCRQVGWSGLEGAKLVSGKRGELILLVFSRGKLSGCERRESEERLRYFLSSVGCCSFCFGLVTRLRGFGFASFRPGAPLPLSFSLLSLFGSSARFSAVNPDRENWRIRG